MADLRLLQGYPWCKSIALKQPETFILILLAAPDNRRTLDNNESHDGGR